MRMMTINPRLKTLRGMTAPAVISASAYDAGALPGRWERGGA